MPPPQTSNLWPKAIIAFFAVFITCLLAFIVFAVSERVDLVRPDYYEQELRYEQQLDRINRAQALSQPIEVAYDAFKQAITVSLPPAHAGRTSGHIHLYRPSDARLDQQLPLVLDQAGAQTLDASHLRAGLWKVRVQWEVEGQEYFFDQSVVIVPPRRA